MRYDSPGTSFTGADALQARVAALRAAETLSPGRHALDGAIVALAGRWEEVRRTAAAMLCRHEHELSGRQRCRIRAVACLADMARRNSPESGWLPWRTVFAVVRECPGAACPDVAGRHVRSGNHRDWGIEQLSVLVSLASVGDLGADAELGRRLREGCAHDWPIVLPACMDVCVEQAPTLFAAHALSSSVPLARRVEDLDDWRCRMHGGLPAACLEALADEIGRDPRLDDEHRIDGAITLAFLGAPALLESLMHRLAWPTQLGLTRRYDAWKALTTCGRQGYLDAIRAEWRVRGDDAAIGLFESHGTVEDLREL